MADWRPLVTDPARRAQLATVIGEIVDAMPAATDLTGHLDQAVMRAYLAQHDIVEDPDDAVGSSLVAAVAAFAAAPVQPALFGGACGLGWTVEHLTGGETAAEVCETIDRALLGCLATWTDDYDLITGLVGFGIYGLERGGAGLAITTQVIELLERSARPHDGGVAWYTRHDLLPAWLQPLVTEGHWDYGLAHGLPGVVGLLARCVRFEVETARVRPLLDGAMTALLAVGPRYPAWLPRAESETRRVAWCYGDLGVAFGVLAAAEACDRTDWRDAALGLARGCATVDDPTIPDASLCHGTAGAAHLFMRLWNATGEELFADAARRWLDRTLAARRTEPVAGFPHLVGADTWQPSDGLLTGAAGVALALHAAITDTEPSWDRILLVDC